jgi:hypothetical protein
MSVRRAISEKDGIYFITFSGSRRVFYDLKKWFLK